MPMRVRLSEPGLLRDLVAGFLRNGCVAHELDDRSCAVVHVNALDAQEAWVEVEFYVRAWQTRHPGVAAVLTR